MRYFKISPFPRNFPNDAENDTKITPQMVEKGTRKRKQKHYKKMSEKSSEIWSKIGGGGSNEPAFAPLESPKWARRLHESTKMDIPRFMHFILLKKWKCEK